MTEPKPKMTLKCRTCGGNVIVGWNTAYDKKGEPIKTYTYYCTKCAEIQKIARTIE